MNRRTPSLKTFMLTVGTILVTLFGLTLPVPATYASTVRLPGNGESIADAPLLEWPTQAGETYALQVAANPAFSPTAVSQTSSSGIYSFPDDLAPGLYYWRYQTLNAQASVTSTSPVWTFTRLSEEGPDLQLPTDGDTINYPAEQPRMQWAPLAGVGRYEVQWDDNPGFRSPGSTTTTNTSYTPHALLPQTADARTYWRVRGVASHIPTVKTAWSTPRWFTISWTGPGPVLSKPSPDAVVDQPVFEWQADPGASTHELQVALDRNFTTLVRPDTGQDYSSAANESPFMVHGTRYVAAWRYPAKAHWWRVRGIDANGTPGPWSSAQQFTRRWTQDSEDLGVENSFTAARAEHVQIPFNALNQFEVSWDAVPDATFYEVQLSLEPSFITEESAVCWTPHTTLAPSFLGSSRDARAEFACPINPQEGAESPFTSATYDGNADTGKVRIIASGPVAGNMVEVRFGAGDPDNGHYRVEDVHESTGDSDPAYFRIGLTRTGTGDVEFRVDSMVLIPGTTYYVRVRAVHLAPSGRIFSLWSDQARYQGDPLPGPTSFTAEEDEPGDGSISLPAEPTAPVDDATVTDWPVLRWKPVEGAHAYLVALTKDEDFTNPLPNYLDEGNGLYAYYVTRSTSFVAQTTLKDNDAGGSYYWYVLPCTSFVKMTCFAADREAIHHSGRWRSFHKISSTLRNPHATSAGEQPWVSLSWEDAYDSTPTSPTVEDLGTGGFNSYELQVTPTTWAEAITLMTDVGEISTAELGLEPETSYRWRVRAIDGALLPMTWTDAPASFSVPDYPGPQGLGTVPGGTAVPCLIWNATGQAKEYRIEIFRGDDGTYPDNAKVASATTANTTLCPDAGLPAGHYSWRVQAVHPMGHASRWSPAPATGVSAPATFMVGSGAPSLLRPADGAAAADLDFAWTEVAGVADYLVEWSVDGFWTVTGSQPVVSPRWTPPSLPLVGFSWRVSARDGDGHVLSTSDPRTVSPPPPPPTVPPTSPTPTPTPAYTPPPNGGAGVGVTPPWFRNPPRLRVVMRRIRVHWSRPTSPVYPPDQYRVLISTNGKNFSPVESVTARAIRFSGRRGRTYWITIKAHSEAGWGPASPVARVTLPKR